MSNNSECPIIQDHYTCRPPDKTHLSRISAVQRASVFYVLNAWEDFPFLILKLDVTEDMAFSTLPCSCQINFNSLVTLLFAVVCSHSHISTHQRVRQTCEPEHERDAIPSATPQHQFSSHGQAPVQLILDT